MLKLFCFLLTHFNSFLKNYLFFKFINKCQKEILRFTQPSSHVCDFTYFLIIMLILCYWYGQTAGIEFTGLLILILYLRLNLGTPKLVLPKSTCTSLYKTLITFLVKRHLSLIWCLTKCYLHDIDFMSRDYRIFERQVFTQLR